MSPVEVIQDYNRPHLYYVQSMNKDKDYVYYTVDTEKRVCSCKGWLFNNEKFERHKHSKIVLSILNEA